MGEHACMNTHMYAWVQYTSQRLMCCRFPCTRCSATGSLISLVARELQGCFSPPLLPSLGETNADKQAQLFLCRFGGSNSGPHPCKQALYHLSFLSSLFSPQFSLSVINHLANAMTAHNLGSAALMFFCRWFLERKTKKHRHCLGYTLPSPKIS